MSEIKKRGRPKKVITEPVEPKQVKPIGRPKLYLSEEELKEAKRNNSTKDYKTRGYIYLKLKTYITKYNLETYTIDDIKNKTPEELAEIYKIMSNQVEEIKKQKHIQYINELHNKMEEALNKKDFKPKSKYEFI